MNKDAKKYYRNIKSVIPLRGKYEQRLLKDYKNRIVELEIERPNITLAELEEQLGHPLNIVRNYYDNNDTDYLMKQLHIARIIKKCITIILIFTFLGFLISVGLNIKFYYDNQNTIITHEEIIIK